MSHQRLHVLPFLMTARGTSSIAANTMPCRFWLRLPSCPSQVSAIGVWGNPLELASHAADIVAALPAAQLLGRPPVNPARIHSRMLELMEDACLLLYSKHALAPYMSREQLLGGWVRLTMWCDSCN
jgi:hypothetical protein